MCVAQVVMLIVCVVGQCVWLRLFEVHGWRLCVGGVGVCVCVCGVVCVVGKPGCM